MTERIKPQSNLTIKYVTKTYNPTTSDNNYQVPTIWINSSNTNSYLLVDISISGDAIWSQISPALGDINYDRIAFVSTTFIENENLHQFPTIQGAIDWAYNEYGVITNFSNPVVIQIFPGIYTEQIYSYDGYNLISVATGWDIPASSALATIYNTGADPAHWPLRSHDGDEYQMAGINIQTENDGVLGKLSSGFYNNCYFKGGHFLEATVAGNRYLRIKGCVSRNNTYGGFYLTGTNLASYGWLSITECDLQGSPIFSSTHSTPATVAFADTKIRGHIEISGDWNFYTSIAGLHTFKEASRNIVDTTGNVEIYRGSFVNGMHFKSAPNNLEIVRLVFASSEDNQIPPGECDITADVDITPSIYNDVSQYNGLCGEMLIPGSVKSVGGNEVNKYKDLVEAIKSVRGTEVLVIFEDMTNLPEITMPAGKVTIDGQKSYSIGFAGNVATLGLDDILVFNRLSGIYGGTVNVNGNNAEFHIHSCFCSDNEIEILATSGVGSKVHLRNANVSGSTGKSVLQINNLDTEYLVSYSRVRGAIGQPAVEFTVEADDKLKARFSAILHGDGAANSPIQRVGGYTVSTSIYMCAGNASLTPSGIANNITGSGNVSDSNINF